jgi:hypothetical protein
MQDEAEANRVVKELHNKRLFNQKVIVSLQRSKQDSATQPSSHKARSRIPSMALNNCSTKPPVMASGKKNTGPLLPVIAQLPQPIRLLNTCIHRSHAEPAQTLKQHNTTAFAAQLACERPSDTDLLRTISGS